MQILMQGMKEYKNKVNLIPPKETNKAPKTDLKEMEIYELSGKEIRIIFL